MTEQVRPFSIAVAALGGQGGGVLAQWIVDVAEANGYMAQYTSVPGVAQRTGATIYYIEIFPESVVAEKGQMPVMALMPAPGDVDVVIAAELLEGGRAVARRFVSPTLTTLIVSDHRVYSISEKEVPGDGRANEETVREAIAKAAKRLILFDMNAAAEETGSVISAVLFGALAGSNALPFSREQYENVIRASGKAVETNLKGFALGYEGAQQGIVAKPAADVDLRPADALATRINAFPQNVQKTMRLGAARLVDYQDLAYANTYIDRLEQVRAAAGNADAEHKLLHETARYLALWMSFEDVMRVADLKTRSGRLDKIGQEVRARPGQHYYVVEYFHPRWEEFCDTLPAWLGRRLLASQTAQKIFGPLFSKGRHIHTAKLSGFLPLYILARLRRWRRGTLRFKKENAAIEAWLQLVKDVAAKDYALAVEIAQCPRLIKGYGDTHARGMERYSRIIELAQQWLGQADAAARVAALRTAALKDAEGAAFTAELQKVA